MKKDKKIDSRITSSQILTEFCKKEKLSSAVSNVAFKFLKEIEEAK